MAADEQVLVVPRAALPDRAGEPDRIVADARRLENEVGFQAAISLERSLADALGYWRAQADAG